MIKWSTPIEIALKATRRQILGVKGQANLG